MSSGSACMSVGEYVSKYEKFGMCKGMCKWYV